MVMNTAGLGPESECAGEGQQQFKTADPSPTCGGPSVGIVRLRTKTTEFFFCFVDPSARQRRC
jgi:hypothetical protein